jgi:hypothetical protein
MAFIKIDNFNLRLGGRFGFLGPFFEEVINEKAYPDDRNHHGWIEPPGNGALLAEVNQASDDREAAVNIKKPNGGILLFVGFDHVISPGSVF